MPARSGAPSTQRWPGVCLLAAGVIGAGCGGPVPADREALIAQAIQRSPEFSTPLFVRLPVLSGQGCEEARDQNPEWARWAGLGLAEARPLVRDEGQGCRLHLVEWVRQERDAHSHLLRSLPRSDSGSGVLVVPLATRDLVRLLGSSKSSQETWEVEFEWHWRPNRAGESLGVGRQPHRGWSRVGWDDAGWRVMTLRFGEESSNPEGS